MSLPSVFAPGGVQQQAPVFGAQMPISRNPGFQGSLPGISTTQSAAQSQEYNNGEHRITREPNSAAANRTRFTDYQIKVLQEFFESKAYPKDDDLENLSKLLGLSPRVIVVWFQNARQKARKIYENQPPADPRDEESCRFPRTVGCNQQDIVVLMNRTTPGPRAQENPSLNRQATDDVVLMDLDTGNLVRENTASAATITTATATTAATPAGTAPTTAPMQPNYTLTCRKCPFRAVGLESLNMHYLQEHYDVNYVRQDIKKRYT